MCIISNCIRSKKHTKRGLTGLFLTIVFPLWLLKELFLLVMYSLWKLQVYSFEDARPCTFNFQNQHGANVKEGNQD